MGIKTGLGLKSIYKPAAIGLHMRQILHITNSGRPVTKHKLTAMNIRFDDGRVRMMLKKDSPKGAQVAYLDADDLEGVIWMAAKMLTANRLKWRVDEWEMKRRKNR